MLGKQIVSPYKSRRKRGAPNFQPKPTIDAGTGGAVAPSPARRKFTPPKTTGAPQPFKPRKKRSAAY